mgnify:CR=1 FL=1
MRNICILIVVTLSLFFVGCASMRGYPNRSDDIKKELTDLRNRYYKESIIDDYNNKKGEAEKKTFRDEVVLGRIRTIDLYYDIFRQALTKENIGLNVGSDLTVIGLNAAGTIIPAASTKAILAAVSGGIVGAKGTISKDVFYDKTIPSLLSMMDALRKEKLVIVQKGLELPTDKYPLFKALIDVNDYFNAGSIPGAIMGITATSGDTIKKSDAELKKIVEVKYDTSAIRRPFSDRINNWLDSALDKNVPVLKDWLLKRQPPITLTPGIWVDAGTTTIDDLKSAIDELEIP